MPDAVMAVVASPWVLPAIFLLCVVDGFFPPVPSESLVIAVAVLTATGHGPSLSAAVAVAAGGALTGDLVAYRIGTRIPFDRIRRNSFGRRAGTAMDGVRHALHRRGACVILAARFVPVGRVAVTMTAGATRYPPPRFVAVATLAAVSWSLHLAVLGVVAGSLLQAHPLVAASVGVAAGLALGWVLDLVIRTCGRTRRCSLRTPQWRRPTAGRG